MRKFLMLLFLITAGIVTSQNASAQEMKSVQLPRPSRHIKIVVENIARSLSLPAPFAIFAGLILHDDYFRAHPYVSTIYAYEENGHFNLLVVFTDINGELLDYGLLQDTTWPPGQ